MNNRLLPIGSIVLLKNGTKPVAIIGYKTKSENGEVYYKNKKMNMNKVFDYCGCTYPEGVIDNNLMCLFDNENIEEVVFEGYVNESYNKFISELKKEEKNEVKEII